MKDGLTTRMSPSTEDNVDRSVTALSYLSQTDQTAETDRQDLDWSPQYEGLEEDSKHRRGEAEDDEVSDGHQRDGSEAAESDAGHEEPVQGDHQPLAYRDPLRIVLLCIETYKIIDILRLPSITCFRFLIRTNAKTGTWMTPLAMATSVALRLNQLTT